MQPWPATRGRRCRASSAGIKPGHRVALLRAPEGFDDTLGGLPDGVAVRRSARGPLDVIVSFTGSERELRQRFDTLARALDPAGGLWIAWPKRASGVPTDLDGNVVREIGLAHGLVDNKVCAIDETWSALRFVVRVEDRPPLVLSSSALSLHTRPQPQRICSDGDQRDGRDDGEHGGRTREPIPRAVLVAVRARLPQC